MNFPDVNSKQFRDIFQGTAKMREMTEKERAELKVMEAAPLLLEALKGFVEVIKMNCFAQKKNIKAADANLINWQSFYEPAVEAINKAEGK